MDYERAVYADFVKAFCEEPGALSSISIMTDTDNTKSVVSAFYGAVQLLPKAPWLKSDTIDACIQCIFTLE